MEFNSPCYDTNQTESRIQDTNKQKAEFKTPTEQNEFQCNNDTYPSNPRLSLRL